MKLKSMAESLQLQALQTVNDGMGTLLSFSVPVIFPSNFTIIFIFEKHIYGTKICLHVFPVFVANRLQNRKSLVQSNVRSFGYRSRSQPCAPVRSNNEARVLP